MTLVARHVAIRTLTKLWRKWLSPHTLAVVKFGADMAIADNRTRATRLQLSMGVFFLAGGAILLALRGDLHELLFQYSRLGSQYVLLMGLLFLVYGFAIFMLLYLRGAISVTAFDGLLRISRDRDEASWKDAARSDFSANALDDQMKELTNVVENLKAAQLGALAGNREELIAALRPTLTADIANELEARYSDSAIDASRLNEIREIFSASHRRLRLELSSLSRRGNLNLVIGVLTTAIAVALLTYMVLGSNTSLDSLTSILSHYVPRITLVLFIEVFSFFFLRLYRSTLVEIRTYQEDITALTLRQVALETAWASSDQSARALIAKDLVISGSGARTDVRASKEFSVDPDLVTDLLQKFAKLVVKKEKAG